MEESTSGLNQGPPAKKPRSPIWLFFTKSANGKEATCKTCQKTYKIPTGTTTTLQNHLKQHPVQLNELKSHEKSVTVIKEEKQLSLKCAFQKHLPMSPDNPTAKKITKAIAEMIPMCYLPYEFVENKGFLNLMKVAVPNYKVPSRNAFSRNHIPTLYTDIKGTLQTRLNSDLAEIASLSLTTDAWTSRAHDGYISLTCHYLRPNFENVSFTMNTLPLNDAHSAENLKKTLQHGISEWGISLEGSIPIYCVTDNAANFRAAAGSLFISRQCFAHSLQLAISDAKTECPGVNILLGKSKAIVGHYSRSTQARKRLHAQMEEMKLPVLELIQYVDTRWCSEYQMLSRLYEVRKAVAAELANSDNNIDMLTQLEMKQVAGIIEILGPLAEATSDISGENYPTSSLVIPILHCLNTHLVDYIAAKKDAITFARCLEKSLKSRFGLFQSDAVYCTAMLCDPRFKSALLNPVLASLTLSKEVKNLPQNEPERSEEIKPSSSGLGLWSAFDQIPNKQSTNDNEVDCYLKEPRLPRESNPYIWWRDEGKLKYPKLANVALKYLSIPATSVSSERVFSSSGNVVTARRQSLTPQHVQELTFLHDNLNKF